MAAKNSKKPPDLAARGARVVSVFGPFASRVLLEMSTEAAGEMFPDGLAASGRTRVIDALEADLEALREREPQLADSALAATAIALAYELEHPYNSATSKAMCAKELRETVNRLRDLAPEERKKDGVDDLSAKRAARLAGGTAT